MLATEKRGRVKGYQTLVIKLKAGNNTPPPISFCPSLNTLHFQVCQLSFSFITLRLHRGNGMYLSLTGLGIQGFKYECLNRCYAA